MISLALRITALMSATLLAIGLIIGAAFYLQRDSDTGSGLRLPLPDQIAAIVELLESTPPPARERLLRAVDTPGFRVRVLNGPLPADTDSSFTGLSRLTQRYLAALGDHRVWAGVDPRAPDENRWTAIWGRRGLVAGAPLRIQVQLRDGHVADFELRGALLRRTITRPLWFTAWSLALLIGLAALWSLRLQIRPLERLAQAVERFGTEDEEPPLRESGAPEVRKLVAAYNRMRERIHELVAGRTRMLAAISHDLGTYLTRLRLRIELIGDIEQRERAERDLADMHQLLRDTLALARMDRLPPNQRVDLGALADLECRALPPHSVHYTPPAASLWVAGDSLALRRVFGNLLGNALKYAGSAELRLSAAEGHAEICVEDRGPGIAAAERKAVLEPFYRGDRARNLDDGGSGLGLAIVADIVRRHQGELYLEDRPGGGLRVRVRLPLLADHTPSR